MPRLTRSTFTSMTTLLAVLTAGTAAACAGRDPLLSPRPEDLARPAPDSFDVQVESSRGPFVIRIRRDWSPLGADRFHYLVRSRYFDGTRFFRVVGGFVAQWGLSGSPAVNTAWEDKTIPDEPVRASNTRGRVSFARGGPNTRSVQLYINLVDNPRLDTTTTFGFPPIGEVTSGMAAVDSFTFEYGGRRDDRLAGPAQDSIRLQGNSYLTRAFPNLDFIRTARVVRTWQER